MLDLFNEIIYKELRIRHKNEDIRKGGLTGNISQFRTQKLFLRSCEDVPQLHCRLPEA